MAVKFYTHVSSTYFFIDDEYQMQLRTTHTGMHKKTELFVSKIGTFTDLLEGVCIFQETEDCKSKLTDYPDSIHKFLLDPQLCIDEYLAKKKTK